MDVYTADYIKMNKKSGICKQLRDTAKNTFYGWLNGAGVATVKMQIQANLGLSVTSDAASIALNGLKDLFNGITTYSQEQIQKLRDVTSIVNGQIVGHMVVNNQLISWVVGKTGDAPNPSPTKATGAIWSRIEATLTKRAGVRILDSIELDGLSGGLLGYNHDDFNLTGSDGFKQSCFNIMRDEFTKATPLSGFGAFGSYEATVIDASGKPITKWSQK
jgi:hypothetical protein